MSNNASNVMAASNPSNSDGVMSNSIIGSCHVGIGNINNNETSSPKSSSTQHMHHHSSATAYSAAAGFWSAAYQGKRIQAFSVDCVVLIFVLFLVCYL